MIALFDLSAKLAAIPLGTGNKTERLLGYFTWHADDSPPLNPIGDLFKTQVWALARHLGVPAAIVDKPPTADLVNGQTDEGDLGISYEKADRILHWLLSGYAPADLTARGMAAKDVATVRDRLERTHWKRRLPTVAMVSGTAIGESLSASGGLLKGRGSAVRVQGSGLKAERPVGIRPRAIPFPTLNPERLTLDPVPLHAAKARDTARFAPRFKARCTTRAYVRKFCPATDICRKNSGAACPLSVDCTGRRRPRGCPACVAPPLASGCTWSIVANSRSRVAPQ